jgi:hypothetical protein
MDIDSLSSNFIPPEQPTEFVQESVSSGWAIVSPAPGTPAVKTPASPSASPKDKRYHRIAPKFKSSTRSSTDSSSHRVKKKRSPYEGAKRVDTHLTRQLHACVRCRMQRNRVCQPSPRHRQMGMCRFLFG